MNNEIIDQIFEEIMSVIQLNQLTINSPNTSLAITNLNNNLSIVSPSLNKTKMLQYHHICCQTIFNIYDHLMIQLNYYR
jgi:hypothetical protein